MPTHETAELLEELRKFTGRPDPVGFARHGIAPGAFSYVAREDRLYIRSRNSVSGAVVTLTGRLHQPDGHIHEFSFNHTPNSDRSLSLERFDLGEGYIVGLAVHPSVGTLRRGQCWVELGLLRGVTEAGAVRQVLGRDYVTTNEAWGWPGARMVSSLHGPGIIRSITGTDPAAGVEISEAVPTNARWLLKTVRFSLVTDATAASRHVHLTIDDGSNLLLEIPSTGPQTASLTRNYNAYNLGGMIVPTDDEIDISLPSGIVLLQGSRLVTSTTLLKAGDNFGAPQLLVEEWLEE